MFEYNSQYLYLNNVLLSLQDLEVTETSLKQKITEVHVTLTSTGIIFRVADKNISFLPDHTRYTEIKNIALDSLNSGYIENDTLEFLTDLDNLLWESADLKIYKNKSVFLGYTLIFNIHQLLLQAEFTNQAQMHSWHLFLKKLLLTPYLEVYSRIGDYMIRNNVELNHQGDLKLKKDVRLDDTDIYSGLLYFKPKSVVTIPRFNLNPNPDSTDPFGINVYPESSRSSPEFKTIDVTVSVEDIVRVPVLNEKLTVHSISVK